MIRTQRVGRFGHFERCYEGAVAFDKIELRKLRRWGPAHFVKHKVPRFASERFYAKENQQDRTFARIDVLVARNLRADGIADAEFFVQLAGQSLFGGFPQFHFASRELPFQWVGLPGLAPADENFPGALDKGGHHLNHSHIEAYGLAKGYSGTETEPAMQSALSIRGGGIRGIIPCCCLMKLEEQLGGLTRDHIAYCAGTSTGALIAAAIAVGVPAADILKVYTDRTKEIFTPTGVIATAKRVAEGFMYDPTHLRDVLVSIFSTAASWSLNDSPLRVMISATEMNGHNWFFVKDNPKNARTTGSVKLLDAAVASSCAPTYFDHWKINIAGKDVRFFDGGVGGTANPAYQASVEMFVYDDFTPQDSLVVSLGTGYFPASDKPPSGLLDIVGWTTSTLVDTSEDWVDAAVRRQWPGVLQTLNPLLPSDIDEADLSAIPALVQVGEQMAQGLDWNKLLDTRP